LIEVQARETDERYLDMFTICNVKLLLVCDPIFTKIIIMTILLRNEKIQKRFAGRMAIAA